MDHSFRPGAKLAWLAAGLGLLAIVVLGAMTLLILMRRGGAVSERPPVTEAVRPVEDYQRLREEEAQRLREYQWIDREDGIARIPIERAMELILERGSLGDSAEAEPSQ
jgi:hypothetical protein